MPYPKLNPYSKPFYTVFDYTTGDPAALRGDAAV